MRAAEITNDNGIILVLGLHDLQIHKLKEECNTIIASDDVFKAVFRSRAGTPTERTARGGKAKGEKSCAKTSSIIIP